jgi:hypothetical protein
MKHRVGITVGGRSLPGVLALIQDAFNEASSKTREQVDAEYAARRATYDGKHRA